MEDVESLLKLVVHIQDRGDVTPSVAIIWCRQNGNEVLISEAVLKTVHDKLMCSGKGVLFELCQLNSQVRLVNRGNSKMKFPNSVFKTESAVQDMSNSVQKRDKVWFGRV